MTTGLKIPKDSEERYLTYLQDLSGCNFNNLVVYNLIKRIAELRLLTLHTLQKEILP